MTSRLFVRKRCICGYYIKRARTYDFHAILIRPFVLIKPWNLCTARYRYTHTTRIDFRTNKNITFNNRKLPLRAYLFTSYTFDAPPPKTNLDRSFCGRWWMITTIDIIIYYIWIIYIFIRIYSCVRVRVYVCIYIILECILLWML